MVIGPSPSGTASTTSTSFSFSIVATLNRVAVVHPFDPGDEDSQRNPDSDLGSRAVMTESHEQVLLGLRSQVVTEYRGSTAHTYDHERDRDHRDEHSSNCGGDAVDRLDDPGRVFAMRTFRITTNGHGSARPSISARQLGQPI
jgi:hypothetical protein